MGLFSIVPTQWHLLDDLVEAVLGLVGLGSQEKSWNFHKIISYILCCYNLIPTTKTKLFRTWDLFQDFGHTASEKMFFRFFKKLQVAFFLKKKHFLHWTTCQMKTFHLSQVLVKSVFKSPCRILHIFNHWHHAENLVLVTILLHVLAAHVGQVLDGEQKHVPGGLVPAVAGLLVWNNLEHLGTGE